MNLILWIIGGLVALFIAYRFFWTLSIFGRGIFLGVLGALVFAHFDMNFWIGGLCGFILGCIVLPIIFMMLGYDYEYMEKLEACPQCGSHRIEKTTEPRGLDDVYIVNTCKSCGHSWRY